MWVFRKRYTSPRLKLDEIWVARFLSRCYCWKSNLFYVFLSTKISVNQAGVSTMVPVTLPVRLVRHGPTPVQSAETWELIYPLLKLKKKMSTFSTDIMVTRRGLVWTTLPLKDYSPGWMVVLRNSATGPRNNQMTLGERTAYTLLVLDMDTRGMMSIVLHVISTPVKRVGNN